MISMLQGEKRIRFTPVLRFDKEGWEKIRKTFHECSDVHVSDVQGRNPGIYCNRRPMDKAGAYGIQGCIWHVYPWD